MLNHLFSSRARVKLITIFMLNTEEEFFVRELTRKLDEQINSIRRELENLKKIGLLKSKTRNRKKYFYVNESFVLLPELRSMVFKSMSSSTDLAKDLSKLGKVDYLMLSGVFVSQPDEEIDLLIVGDIAKEALTSYVAGLSKQFQTEIRYSLLSTENFLYRKSARDKFLMTLLENKNNITAVDKLKDK